MNATEITDFTVNKAHCDWIIDQAKELKALFSYESESMIRLNKVRALSCIDTMMDSLNELKAAIEPQALDAQIRSAAAQRAPVSETKSRDEQTR